MRFAVFFVLFFLFACERPTHGYALQSHNPATGATNTVAVFYSAHRCEDYRLNRSWYKPETEWRCVRVDL